MTGKHTHRIAGAFRLGVMAMIGAGSALSGPVTMGSWKLDTAGGALRLFYGEMKVVEDQRVRLCIDSGNTNLPVFDSGQVAVFSEKVEEEGESRAVRMVQENETARMERTIRMTPRSVRVMTVIRITGRADSRQENWAMLRIPRDGFVASGSNYTMYGLESGEQTKRSQTNMILPPEITDPKQHTGIAYYTEGLRWTRGGTAFLISDLGGPLVSGSRLDYFRPSALSYYRPSCRPGSRWLLDDRRHQGDHSMHLNTALTVMRDDTIRLGFEIQAAPEAEQDKLALPAFDIFTDVGAGDPPFAYYLCLNKVEPLPAAGPTTAQAPELPNDLVIAPGDYCFQGQSYRLDREGLYRFFRPPDISAQRIVYKGDIRAFFSALCWIVTHGERDNWKPTTYLNEQAKVRKLSMTCGNTANWARDLLKQIGYEARRIDTLTTEKWNTYDNGHALLEVYLPAEKKWALMDLDCNVAPKRNGRYMTVLEFEEAVRDNDYNLDYLATDINFALGRSRDGDSGMGGEIMLNTEEQLRKWYRRIAHIPQIGSHYTTLTPADKARCETYCRLNKTKPRIYLERPVFVEKYYQAPVGK